MAASEHLSEAKRILLDRYLRGEVVRVGNTAPARRAAECPVPLSLAQEQVWLRAQRTPERPTLYNESITIHRTGPLDVQSLQRTLTEIVRRHEAWRTAFEVRHGRACQVVVPAPESFPLAVIDLSKMSELAAEAEALRLGSEDAQRPFDLARGPLVRGLLVKLSDTRHQLFLTMHQAIVDGISIYKVLPTELATIYDSFSSDAPSPLPELPLQFGDFAAWQHDRMTAEVIDEQLEYWRKQLGVESPVLPWPRDRQRPSSLTCRGFIKPFWISKQIVDSLHELSAREEVSLFSVLVAAFASLLHEYTNEEHIVIGTLAPCGRERSEFQNLLGYFLSPVALRLDFRASPLFGQLARQSQAVIAGAIGHGDVPLERVARELLRQTDPSHHPFFDVAISLAPSLAPLPTGWHMTAMDVQSGGARWDLYLELSETPEGLLGRAQYNPDLFFPETIDKTLEDFSNLLEAASSDTSLQLSKSLAAT